MLQLISVVRHFPDGMASGDRPSAHDTAMVSCRLQVKVAIQDSKCDHADIREMPRNVPS